MNFDPVSYAAGYAAGKNSGGGGAVMVPLIADDNGRYTPMLADGFSTVEVAIPSANGREF